jgi:hypothetical protein
MGFGFARGASGQCTSGTRSVVWGRRCRRGWPKIELRLEVSNLLEQRSQCVNPAGTRARRPNPPRPNSRLAQAAGVGLPPTVAAGGAPFGPAPERCIRLLAVKCVLEPEYARLGAAAALQLVVVSNCMEIRGHDWPATRLGSTNSKHFCCGHPHLLVDGHSLQDLKPWTYGVLIAVSYVRPPLKAHKCPPSGFHGMHLALRLADRTSRAEAQGGQDLEASPQGRNTHHDTHALASREIALLGLSRVRNV